MLLAMIPTATITVLTAICLALVILAILSLRSFDLEDHLHGGNMVHGKPDTIKPTDQPGS